MIGNWYEDSRNIFSSVEHINDICQKIQTALTKHFQLCYKDEKRSVYEFGKSFVKEHYPNISKETYSYPLVIQPLHSHESTSDMEKKNRNQQKDSKKFNARKGYEAEQKTARVFLRMFEHFKIPAFIIRSYVWNKTLCKHLVDVLKEDFSNEMPNDGEQDILAFLPNVGVLLIEVKAQSEKKFQKGLEKIRKQLIAGVRCIAYSTLDLTVDRNFPFVKVASFPNCSRDFIKTKFCDKCCRNFIAEEDLSSKETLYLWYKNLIHPLEDGPCDFDPELVESMVTRFIGPLTNIVVEGISEVITETCISVDKHGSAEQIKNLFQLNEEQKRICFRDPCYLWITGDPGTGKTVLAMWKVQQILKSTKHQKHVIYLIGGNKDMMLIKVMKKLFESNRTEKKNDVQLIIEPIESICPGIHHWYDWKDLLYVIQTLTSSHPHSHVSIVVDEFWLVSNNERGLPKQKERGKKNLKLGNLKNLWIIQKPSCEVNPQLSILDLGFKPVKLKRIMRMSAPTVKFIRQLLDNTIMDGHACDGPPPELYTMECICKELQAADESTCIPFLIRRLTEEVLRKLKDQSTAKGNDNTFKRHEEELLGISPAEKLYSNGYEDVVVMTKMNVKVKKLLSQKQLEVLVRPAVYFTGCEKKLVMVDIRNEGSFGPKKQLKEALTRAKGQLVLFDVCCKNAKEEDRYLPKEEIKDAKLRELLDKLYDLSQTDIRRHEKVELDEEELDLLRFEISLGLYRDEQEIHENMGSLVTVDLLQKTLHHHFLPIMTQIENLQTSVSDIPQLRVDIRNANEKLDNLTGMLQTFMNPKKSDEILDK